jgi:flagellin
MIGGPNSSLYNLSNIYSANNTLIAQAMARIASGKRVQSPGDDFAGFALESKLQGDIAQYQTVKQNLQDGKSYTDYGTAVGNNIVSDLSSMKDLATSYAVLADPTGTDLAQANSLTAQFNSLKSGIADQIANSKYDNTAIYKTTLAKTVTMDSNGTTLTITPTAVGDASALTVSGGAAAVQTQIDAAEKYVSDMQSFGSQITRQSNLADTVISSKQATISVIADNNDAEDQSTLTALQVRQEATVAMMAQANMVQGYAAKLFGGNF